MSFSIDQARPVRDGEQLDIGRLSVYLAAHLPGANEPVSVEQFLHGHSNLTYLIKVGADEWVLRRPPFGNRVKTAHDMGREYRILSRLHTVYPLAPQPVLYCEDESVLGAPFYLMERRRGVILRGSPSADRPLAPELVRRLCETLVDRVAELHALDYGAAGLAELGKPQGYAVAPGDGLDQALSRRPHGRDARCGAGRGLAGREHPGRIGRIELDSQRFQVRQPRAGSGGLDAHRGAARLGDGHDWRSADGSRDNSCLLDPSLRPRAAALSHRRADRVRPAA